MSTVSGTITGAHLLKGPTGGLGKRYTYLVTFDTDTYTASTDSGSISSVATAIGNLTQDGKSLTLRSATSGYPGVSAGGTAVYATAVTVSTNDITFNLGSETAEANVASAKSISIIAVLDE